MKNTFLFTGLVMGMIIIGCLNFSTAQNNSGTILASGGPCDIPRSGTICPGIKYPPIEQQGKGMKICDSPVK